LIASGSQIGKATIWQVGAPHIPERGYAAVYRSMIQPIEKQQMEKTSIPSIGPDVILPLSSSITARAGRPSPIN
jgi:hypothetical protein